MTGPDLLAPAALVGSAVLAVVVLALVVRVRADRARAQAVWTELAETRAESAALRARVDALARQAESRRGTGESTGPGEYVITGVGVPTASVGPERAVVPTVEGRLFADLVLRESLVKAAALAHGVRHALRPETRNRIRFEMRREVKRSRRRRREDLRELRRELHARDRAREVA